jgi:hypothetical protein
MKPSRLEWLPDNVMLQVHQIDGGVIKQTVAVPGRGAEIPEM